MHDPVITAQTPARPLARLAKLAVFTLAGLTLLAIWFFAPAGGIFSSLVMALLGSSSTSTPGLNYSVMMAGQPIAGTPITVMVGVSNTTSAPRSIASIDFAPTVPNEFTIQSVTPPTPMTSTPSLVTLTPTGPIPANGSVLYRVTLVYPAAGDYELSCTVTETPTPPAPAIPITTPFLITVVDPPASGP